MAFQSALSGVLAHACLYFAKGKPISLKEVQHKCWHPICNLEGAACHANLHQCVKPRSVAGIHENRTGLVWLQAALEAERLTLQAKLKDAQKQQMAPRMHLDTSSVIDHTVSLLEGLLEVRHGNSWPRLAGRQSRQL